MTQTKNSIDSRKGKRLSYAEYCQIKVLKKEDYSNRQIARVLERALQTKLFIMKSKEGLLHN